MLMAPFPGSQMPLGSMMWSPAADMSWPGVECDHVAMAAAAAVSQLPATPSLEAGLGDPWADPVLIAERIRQLQQHVDELELWKHQAEENMRSFHEDCLLRWQAKPADASSTGTWSPPTEQAGSSPATLLEQPDDSSGGSTRTSSPIPFSSLPLPLRIQVGPAPPIPARSPSGLGTSLAEIDAKVVESDPSLALGPGAGLLPPPGLTLARAASLPIGGENEGSGKCITAPTKPSSPRRLPQTTAVFQETPAKSAVKAVSKASAPGTVASLATKPPPGIARSTSITSTAGMFTGSATESSPGIFIGPTEIAHTPCTRVEWRIEDLRGRLQASMGRPLVSPSFAACGLPNLRLMVFPDAREAVKSARSRERKGMYAAMVKKGPLYGSLKLKADCLERATVLYFHLTVGTVRRGPFTYDFAEQAIHGCDDFGVDWLKQVDESTGGLRVAVEILEPSLSDQDALDKAPDAEDDTTTCIVDPTTDAGSARARGKRGAASQSRLRGC